MEYNSIVNSSVKTRHSMNKQQEVLMQQVMEMYSYQQKQKQSSERQSQLEQERELLQIVKIVSIERNLSQHQTQELILGAMRQLLEQELVEMQSISSVRPLQQIR